MIALVITAEGFPLAYEVLAGNTSDKTTLSDFLKKIEQQYGQARRIWIMDRGVPTEATLTEMRTSSPVVSYLVGTPRGRLSKLEKAFLALPWENAQESAEVTGPQHRPDAEGAFYAPPLETTLEEATRIATTLKRDELLVKLGAAKTQAGTADPG